MKSLIIFVVAFMLTGCAVVAEPFKMLWGSSTRALEQARPDAIRATFPFALAECMSYVRKIVTDNRITIFIDNPQRDFLVLIHIPGSVDTTEVGIFFAEEGTPGQDALTRIEVSSLSRTAKEAVSTLIFSELKKL